jgi:hypothetical protein
MHMNKRHYIIGTIVAVIIGGIVGFVVADANKKSSDTPQKTNQEKVMPKPTPAPKLNIEAVLADVKIKFPTITQTKVFTEANDPNGVLGKEAGYSSGGAFWDSRTGYSEDSSEPGKWGTDAGGAIEVYPNKIDADTRASYLGEFDQSSLLSPGAFKQVGNVVVRASSRLDKSQQDEIIAFLEQKVK